MAHLLLFSGAASHYETWFGCGWPVGWSMKTEKKAVTSKAEARTISLRRARQIWLAAQGLTRRVVRGRGAKAVADVVRHLGYVQIDTIHVIERCHHHILHTRLPDYRRKDLQQAQSQKKSVFEYWTHALAYVSTEDYRFFMPAMAKHRRTPDASFARIREEDTRRLLERIAREGAISLRDINDDVLVEKDHAWASRKPSKRVMSKAFYEGELTVSSRLGMLKAYDLTDRHFGWSQRPEPASETELNDYLLDRALRSQGIISLDSACYLEASRKPAIRALIDSRVATGQLVPVQVKGIDAAHWVSPEFLDARLPTAGNEALILSPFDPLVIQRKRLELFFGYAHRFEAYVPPDKRVLGYFALPILYGDRIVGAIDIKADRQKQQLTINQWTRFGDEGAEQRVAIDAALHAFETFQFAE